MRKSGRRETEAEGREEEKDLKERREGPWEGHFFTPNLPQRLNYYRQGANFDRFYFDMPLLLLLLL